MPKCFGHTKYWSNYEKRCRNLLKYAKFTKLCEMGQHVSWNEKTMWNILSGAICIRMCEI